MGNAKSTWGSKSKKTFKEEHDFLYIDRMSLLLCALSYDKEAQDKGITTRRILSNNVRPMQLIYIFLKPPVNISEIKKIMSMKEPRCLVFDNINGHAGQCMLEGAWFRTTTLHNNSPVFSLRGKECFGHSDMVLFKDTQDRWRMASDSLHRKTGKDICYFLGLNGTKNDESPLGAVFKIYNGSSWTVKNEITCENQSSPIEIALHLSRANFRIRKEMREMGSVKGVRFRKIKGQAGQHILNGCYVLSEDKMMQGRGVYEYVDGSRYGYDDLVRCVRWIAHFFLSSLIPIRIWEKNKRNDSITIPTRNFTTHAGTVLRSSRTLASRKLERAH